MLKIYAKAQTDVTYAGASFRRELHRPYEESRMVYDVGYTKRTLM